MEWRSVVAAAGNLVEFARRMEGDGLSIGTSGNLSCRVDNMIVITPSGFPYSDLQSSDCCLLDLSGCLISGEGVPSSETPLHTLVYKETSALAVVHTHSPAVVALSVTHEVLPAIHYSIVGLGGSVSVAPYERFASDSLARAAVSQLHEKSAVILQNHGAVTCGPDLRTAYERAKLLEWLSDVFQRAVALGNPRILNDEELDNVRDEARRRKYGLEKVDGGSGT